MSSKSLALTLAALSLAAWLPAPADAAVRTTAVNIDTVPPGAEVTLVEPAPEKLLGVTPLKKVRVPRGATKLRFKLAGYEDRTAG
jgi:hypothetical protein